MLSIQIPGEDLSGFAQLTEIMATIKECEVSTFHEWHIPCGSGIQLTIKLDGPVGFQMTPAYFDQAIRLLEVAKEGVTSWPGSTTLSLKHTQIAPSSEG